MQYQQINFTKKPVSYRQLAGRCRAWMTETPSGVTLTFYATITEQMAEDYWKHGAMCERQWVLYTLGL